MKWVILMDAGMDVLFSLLFLSVEMVVFYFSCSEFVG